MSTRRQKQELPCDSKNPSTGRICVLGHHNGYHRDETGAEWLDEGGEADQTEELPEWERSPEPWLSRCREAYDEGFDGGISEALGFIDLLLRNNSGPAFVRAEIEALRNTIARELERPEST